MKVHEILSLEKETVGEACGIFAGAGSLYRTARSCVLEVRTGADEMQYLEKRVKPLFEAILSEKLATIKRFYPGGHVIGIRFCGPRAMKIFHVILEFPAGRKTHHLHMPKIIWNNMEYWKAYLRGLFDTKGSVYMRRTGKKYSNPVIEISSRSLGHLAQLKEILRDLGFIFWLEKGNFKIRIAGRKNVERFFKEIKPHNNAKLEKFAEIMRIAK